jgi:hypothetical protein
MPRNAPFIWLFLLTVSQLTAAAPAPAPPNPDEHYTIRATMRILNPVNVAAMNDERQTATVVRTTEEYTDVALTLFPLMQPQVKPRSQWRDDAKRLEEFVRPGPTSNWNDAMRAALVNELKNDGIDVAKLDDVELVTQVSRWLLKRTKTIDMFDTWFVEFDAQGTPRVAPGLERRFREKGSIGDVAWTDRQQFERELLGRSMFAEKCAGTCTSYAILQQTVLRALGVPTRIVLTIPIADVNDEAQIDLVRTSLQHHKTRAIIASGLNAMSTGGWSSHTINEVFVRGRWELLNYSSLGQAVLDGTMFGAVVRVDTINDWADTKYAPTWGKRYATGERSDALRTANPYRLLALSDAIGKNAKVANPQVDDGVPKTVNVSRAYWQSDPRCPKQVGPPRDGGPNYLMLHVTDQPMARNYRLLKEFMRRAGREITLSAPGKPPVTAQVTLGSVTSSPDVCEVYLLVPPEQFAKLDRGLAYTLKPPAEKDGYAWSFAKELSVTLSP